MWLLLQPTGRGGGGALEVASRDLRVGEKREDLEGLDSSHSATCPVSWEVCCVVSGLQSEQVLLGLRREYSRELPTKELPSTP